MHVCVRIYYLHARVCASLVNSDEHMVYQVRELQSSNPVRGTEVQLNTMQCNAMQWKVGQRDVTLYDMVLFDTRAK